MIFLDGGRVIKFEQKPDNNNFMFSDLLRCCRHFGGALGDAELVRKKHPRARRRMRPSCPNGGESYSDAKASET